jgi:hypothetical protein
VISDQLGYFGIARDEVARTTDAMFGGQPDSAIPAHRPLRAPASPP